MATGTGDFDRRISLHKLEVFCLVVDLGGVGRAAEHLFVAQPVVSAHVRSLQERLGTQLMYREGQRMRLTETGERVYAWARDTLARMRELAREIDEIEDGSGGAVALAASMSFGSYLLPDLLSDFRRARPHARITLHVFDPERAVGTVENGICDLAVVVGDGPLASRSLQAERLGDEPVLLVKAPETELGADPLPLAAIETLPLVLPPQGEARRTIVDRQLTEAGVTPRNIAIELGHPEAMKRAARRGLGAAFLTRSSVAQELESGVLQAIELEEDIVLSVPLVVVRESRRRPTPTQDALVAALREGLTARLMAR